MRAGVVRAWCGRAYVYWLSIYIARLHTYTYRGVLSIVSCLVRVPYCIYILIYEWYSVLVYEVDPGKSGLRLGQAVRAEGSASDVRVIAVRLVYM